MLDELCKGLGEIALAAGLIGFCEDHIRIVVIENHDIIGAAAGGVRKMTGLVAENSSRNRHHFGKQTMDSDVGIGRDG